MFPGVYVASDIDTALKETLTVFDLPGREGHSVLMEPWTVFAVDGILTDVLDLTDLDIQQKLGTNLQELTGDWKSLQSLYLQGKSTLPPTQILGQAAYDSGSIVGLKYPAAKNPSGTAPSTHANYLVYTERLAETASGYLEVVDPHDWIPQRLP